VATQVAAVLAQVQAWEQARTLAHSIEDAASRARALSSLVETLAQTANQDWLLFTTEQAWKQATSRSYLLDILQLARDCIVMKPELDADFAQAFTWVSAMLQA